MNCDLNFLGFRSMEVGPHGMRLVQIGSSAPAASVVAANTVAFSRSASQNLGDGGARGSASTLLAQQLHTPPTTSSFPVLSSQPPDLLHPSSLAAPSFPLSNAFSSLAEQSLGSERQLLIPAMVSGQAMMRFRSTI